MQIPQAIRDRMAAAPNPETGRREGVLIAREMLEVVVDASKPSRGSRQSVLSQARAVLVEALSRTQQAGKARAPLEKMAKDSLGSAPGHGSQARRRWAFAGRRYEY